MADESGAMDEEGGISQVARKAYEQGMRDGMSSGHEETLSELRAEVARLDKLKKDVSGQGRSAEAPAGVEHTIRRLVVAVCSLTAAVAIIAAIMFLAPSPDPSTDMSSLSSEAEEIARKLDELGERMDERAKRVEALKAEVASLGEVLPEPEDGGFAESIAVKRDNDLRTTLEIEHRTDEISRLDNGFGAREERDLAIRELVATEPGAWAFADWARKYGNLDERLLAGALLPDPDDGARFLSIRLSSYAVSQVKDSSSDVVSGFKKTFPDIGKRLIALGEAMKDLSSTQGYDGWRPEGDGFFDSKPIKKEKLYACGVALAGKR